MGVHFGPSVQGAKEYDKAVRQEKGGANVFGARVRGAIPEDGPTNLAKRATEFGPAVLDGAHGSDVTGKPAESVSIEQLRNILAENPTFFDSLFEAELARAEGARPDALAIFYEVERGIKGQAREDVLKDIRNLLGQKGVDASVLADRAQAHRIQIEEQQARSRENALLGDADRIKALREREDNLAIVREGHSKSGRSQMVASDTEGQLHQIAEREGLDITGGQDSGVVGKIPAKPDGPVHPETQSPGNRLGVPKGSTHAESGEGTSTEGSGQESTSPAGGASSGEGDDSEDQETEETAKLDDMNKADLEDYLGTEEVGKVKGTGAGDRITRDDLLKAAKRKQRRDKKES